MASKIHRHVRAARPWASAVVEGRVDALLTSEVSWRGFDNACNPWDANGAGSAPYPSRGWRSYARSCKGWCEDNRPGTIEKVALHAENIKAEVKHWWIYPPSPPFGLAALASWLLC